MGAASDMVTGPAFLAPAVPLRSSHAPRTSVVLRSKPRTRVCARSRATIRLSASGSSAQAAAPVFSDSPSSVVSPEIPYACPTCRASVRPPREQRCATCNTQFPVFDGFVEMIRKRADEAGAPALLRPLFDPPKQSLFQNAVLPFVYERGYRRNFETQGFPGPEAEYAMMEEFFLDGTDGEARGTADSSSGMISMDLSSGSGFMARRMVKGGRLGRVIAVDFSAEMLRETSRRAKAEGISLETVRADAARLPFETSSIDRIHCGAAVHCWPRLQDGLAEVHRVLRPGGRFFATTFLKNAFRPEGALGRAIHARTVPRPFRFFDESELLWLLRAAGFVNVRVETIRYCAIVRCEKAQ